MVLFSSPRRRAGTLRSIAREALGDQVLKFLGGVNVAAARAADLHPGSSGTDRDFRLPAVGALHFLFSFIWPGKGGPSAPPSPATFTGWEGVWGRAGSLAPWPSPTNNLKNNGTAGAGRGLPAGIP